MTITVSGTLSLSLSNAIEELAAPYSDDLIDKMKGSYLWLVILIAVVAALLICFVIAFILYRRRKRSHAEMEAFASLTDGEDILLGRNQEIDNIYESRNAPLGQEMDDWGDDIDELNSQTSDFGLEVDIPTDKPAFSAAAATTASVVSTSKLAGSGKVSSSGFSSTSDAADGVGTGVEKDGFFTDDSELPMDFPTEAHQAAHVPPTQAKADLSDSFFESSEHNYTDNINRNNQTKYDISEKDSFATNSSDDI
eukprot:GILI01013772.1.p1 GENE.GILI01013772.1~~GILI01013772.1.p1  ORF type:complete len:252 (-),score=58.51 GILI01013772.1:555-1310(-)